MKVDDGLAVNSKVSGRPRQFFVMWEGGVVGSCSIRTCRGKMRNADGETAQVAKRYNSTFQSREWALFAATGIGGDERQREGVTSASQGLRTTRQPRSRQRSVTEGHSYQLADESAATQLPCRAVPNWRCS